MLLIRSLIGTVLSLATGIAHAQVPINNAIVNPSKLIPKHLEAWKVTLLATQWLLLSAQTIPPDVSVSADWQPPLQPKPVLHPLEVQQRMLPPKEFDHDYDGTLTVKYMIFEDIQRECRLGMRPGLGAAFACTRRNNDGPGTCTIWTMTRQAIEGRGWNYDFVMRHEIAHCNGWRH